MYQRKYKHDGAQFLLINYLPEDCSKKMAFTYCCVVTSSL